MKSCSFFGHRDTPQTEELKERVREIVERLIVEENVNTFLFGIDLKIVVESERSIFELERQKFIEKGKGKVFYGKLQSRVLRGNTPTGILIDGERKIFTGPDGKKRQPVGMCLKPAFGKSQLFLADIPGQTGSQVDLRCGNDRFFIFPAVPESQTEQHEESERSKGRFLKEVQFSSQHL